MNRYKARKKAGRCMQYLLVTGFGAVFMLPFVWLVVCSLKTEPELFRSPPTFFPAAPTFANYLEAVRSIPFFRFALNTAWISLLSIAGSLLSCSLVAFAIAKLEWKLRGPVFALVLATMMIPYQVTMIPVYLIWNSLGFVDTYLPLVLPYFFAPSLYVFLMRQFYLTIPDSLLDSARLDGAGNFTIWRHIMLPLSKGVMAAVAVFTLLAAWSDFLGPLIYINSVEKRTLSIGLTMFLSEYTVEWGALMAAAAIFSGIIVIPFFVFQKQLIGSLKLSGLK